MPQISDSPYLVQAEGLRACWHRPEREKVCIRCERSKPLAGFYAYDYTTRQGKRSIRYESRCKECARERRKERSRANPSMDAEVARKRRREKPEWYAEYQKAYQASEHGRAVRAKLQRLRKARMRSRSGDDDAIRAIYAEAMVVERIIANCPVFDIPELGKKMHVDHIFPLSRGGRHDASNLQILPSGLNVRKGASCPR